MVYDKSSPEGGDDWGVAYCESNSITVGTWRTLSTAEWQYLFNTRNASTVNDTENARYAKATVNNQAGIILLPDTYEHPTGVTLTNINTETAAFTANDYSVTDWGKMESAGAVFLPAAGFRYGSYSMDVGEGGYYWSSSAVNGDNAYGVCFSGSNVLLDRNTLIRGLGYSVRLVTDVK